jgi:hypothetical protein
LTGATDRTIEAITTRLEDHRASLDSFPDLRTLFLLVRYDRQTGNPEVVNVRPESETSERKRRDHVR